LSLSRFLFLFCILAAIIGLAAFIIEISNPENTVLIPKYWVIFGFLMMITIIAYVASMFGIKNAGENSVYIILGSVIVKLLFCMSFVAVYLLKFKVNSVIFATEFFSLYFLFTSFEVYALLCNLRHQNKT